MICFIHYKTIPKKPTTNKLPINDIHIFGSHSRTLAPSKTPIGRRLNTPKKTFNQTPMFPMKINSEAVIFIVESRSNKKPTPSRERKSPASIKLVIGPEAETLPRIPGEEVASPHQNTAPVAKIGNRITKLIIMRNSASLLSLK